MNLSDLEAFAAVVESGSIVGAAGRLYLTQSAVTKRIQNLEGVLDVILLDRQSRHMAGLIMGVILLDLGVQAGHVSNQTRIYALLPEARSRLNMVYMFCYFSAGAIGSYAGTVCWQQFGWKGVCALGVGMILFGVAIHTLSARSQAGGAHEESPAQQTAEMFSVDS
jgi:predicted MFS family arabinose efflux permease